MRATTKLVRGAVCVAWMGAAMAGTAGSALAMNSMTSLFEELEISAGGGAGSGANGTGAASGAYADGQRALDAREWARAAELFAKAAAEKAEQADAALYWQAYAERRAGKRSEALQTLQRLRAQYPKSGWLDDARALEIELDGGKPVRTVDVDDEELKLYALQSLANADPERAVTTIEKFLSIEHSPKLEEQALFVLSQADSPRAKQMLADIAVGKQHPQLREKAIHALGVAGDAESARLLGELYGRTEDVAVRSQVLEAYMVQGDEKRLLAAARTEKNPTLRRKA